MPQYIRAPSTKIVTKNGECNLSIIVDPIVIELKLHITTDGNVSVGEGGAQVKAMAAPKEEEKQDWVLPTFKSQKISFGKKE